MYSNGRILNDKNIEFPHQWFPNDKETDDKPTQKKLLVQRKKDFVPHISFHIQGDDKCSNPEFFIA